MSMDLHQMFTTYRAFCYERMSQLDTDKDLKIKFMSTVIDNIFDQNEALMSTLAETGQSVGGTSVVMNGLLQKSAQRTDEVMLALETYEQDLKKLAGRSLPSLVEYDQVVEQLRSEVNTVEAENVQLRTEKEELFQDSLSLNRQLVLYKGFFYHTLYEQPPANVCNDNIEEDCSFLGFVKQRKLAEERDNVNTIVCAHLLEELIDKVEEDDTREDKTSNNDIKVVDTSDEGNSNTDYYDIVAMMIDELEYQNVIVEEVRHHRSRLLEETRLLRSKLINLCDHFWHVLQQDDGGDVNLIRTESIELIEQIRSQLDEELDDRYNNNLDLDKVAPSDRVRLVGAH